LINNPYQSQQVKILEIINEAPAIKRFKLELPKNFLFLPGQIIFASIPGFGEAPFAPCNPLTEKYLELCVRRAGKFTAVLHTLKIGDIIGIRGPYGQGWPFQTKNKKLETKNIGEQKLAPKLSNDLPAGSRRFSPANPNLLIVIGGLGLVPLRTLIWGKNKFLPANAKIQIFYGAKTPPDFLFHKDFSEWQKQGIDLQLTIDRACYGWNGCIGLVTKLFDEHKIVENASAFLCGPPIMYKFVLQKLKEKKFPEKNIYMSLERRMHCGVGVCQHCAVGSFYACKNGPVFKYTNIKSIPGAI
jgi:NAD(P)H-flavin reductase